MTSRTRRRQIDEAQPGGETMSRFMFALPRLGETSRTWVQPLGQTVITHAIPRCRWIVSVGVRARLRAATAHGPAAARCDTPAAAAPRQHRHTILEREPP